MDTGEAMRGILILDKEAGMTSFGAVSRLRRILNTRKIGHTGTLDPEATGVLPVCIGSATKLVELFRDHDKEYIAGIRFGLISDTQDIFGNVLKEEEAHVTREEFGNALKHFTGKIRQLTPMYSARKVNGQPLYKLARKGIEVERSTKEITVYETELLAFNEEKQEAVFRVACSSGTYIRTLCHDIGTYLSCGAVMSELQRTKAGPFSLSDAITLREAEALMEKGQLSSCVLPPDFLLSSYPEARAEAEAYPYLVNGNPLKTGEFSVKEGSLLTEGTKFRMYYNRIFYGLYEYRGDALVPFKLFLPEPGEENPALAVTVGKFDGLHKGHQTIISEMKRAFPELLPALLTFDFHGAAPEFLRKKVLFTDSERALIYRAFGFRRVIVYPFTEELRTMSPEDFLGKLIRDELHAEAFFCGENFRFGFERKGDADFLREHASEYGIRCRILPELKDGETVISSTGLRRELSENELSTLEFRLGFPYFLSGAVSYGAQIGRTIGFRTANLSIPEEKCVPKPGVYASISVLSGKAMYSMTNIGHNPTVRENGALLAETHLFDYDGSCYGKRLTVFLCEYIREEKKFSSVPELKKQLSEDFRLIRSRMEEGRYAASLREIREIFCC